MTADLWEERQAAKEAGAAEAAPVSAIPQGEVWPYRRGRFLRALERLSLWFEKPFTRLAGAAQLNPFYHTGTLAVFLWLLVGATGLYLTMFYQYGFEVSYAALGKLEASLAGRTIRALHNYASGAAMIVTALHGWRLFFMDRFFGPRWLAWLSGVGMTLLLWADGVLGYWLAWDARAQLITGAAARFLDAFTPWASPFLLSLDWAAEKDKGWIFIISLWLVHTLLFAIAGLFYWYHILRLRRPKFLPPAFWMLAAAAALVLVSAAWPLGLLPPVDFSRIPVAMRLDAIYLFFIPAQDAWPPGLLWSGLLLAGAGLGALPWVWPRRLKEPPVRIDPQLCTGCTKCALDCPYKAISLQPRTDGKRRKYLAVENPALCVSCGICVGSCDVQAISLGDLTQEALWRAVETRLAHIHKASPDAAPRLVFTCERHAVHGASGWQDGADASVIALPCVAAAPPNLAARALSAGAAQVHVVGCPPADCARREGNLWQEMRLKRKRLPKLRKPYDQAPIFTHWLPPDATRQVLRPGGDQSRPLPAAMEAALTWRNYLPAFVILLIALLLQVALNRLPYDAASGGAEALLVMGSPSDYLHGWKEPAAGEIGPARLVWEADGALLYEQSYPPATLYGGKAAPVFARAWLPPGEYRLTLRLETQGAGRATLIIFERSVLLKAGDSFAISRGEELPLPLKNGAR
jgi:ferredoxin